MSIGKSTSLSRKSVHEFLSVLTDCNSLLPKVLFLPLFSSTKRISILPGQHKVHFLTLFTGIRWKTAQQLTEVSEF